jgi:alpha-tubulin suppressor-like RCC1 family protein
MRSIQWGFATLVRAQISVCACVSLEKHFLGDTQSTTNMEHHTLRARTIQVCVCAYTGLIVLKLRADPYFYYLPRKIVSLGDVKLERCVSGNQFTLAVTSAGDLYSWGWNAYGVLGHGQGHYAQVMHERGYFA